MIIVIFGPPGSGKGTQSSFLVKRYNLQLISVGDLLRDIVSSESDLGQKIKSIIESGNLIQDNIICELLSNALPSASNLLLDGFPRNINQARFLTQTLKEKCNKDVDFALELQIADNIVIDRLRNRLVCLDCKSIYNALLFQGDTVCAKCKSTRLEKRTDDMNEDVIQTRIREYNSKMKSLREYYKTKLLIVDASLNVAQVTEEIKMLINIK
ncbi:adenylate kinase [Wolbachia pipientis]|uniref:Adenylate kinase n=1 Tax=Wolbachia pipientis TaxID=955 RepID=A0A1E7QJ42_WOLPI|nr:nucleoside monophosphate kinase [Wolbachia pipientis]OEY86397.1 adenylate kinase [Wolbachia pipientis]